jgi:hypothetical protein
LSVCRRSSASSSRSKPRLYREVTPSGLWARSRCSASARRAASRTAWNEAQRKVRGSRRSNRSRPPNSLVRSERHQPSRGSSPTWPSPAQATAICAVSRRSSAPVVGAGGVLRAASGMGGPGRPRRGAGVRGRVRCISRGRGVQSGRRGSTRTRLMRAFLVRPSHASDQRSPGLRRTDRASPLAENAGLVSLVRRSRSI